MAKKKPRFSYFSRQVCDLMEPPPAWALHGIVKMKIGRHGRRSDEWHNDQLGDTYPKVQGTQELPMPKVGRMMEDGKSEVFNDFCVHAPSVPSCCRWLCQLPERADASVEPTSIGPGGNLLSTATPCCFTHLHSTACNICN